jgi:hypothetical protein
MVCASSPVARGAHRFDHVDHLQIVFTVGHLRPPRLKVTGRRRFGELGLAGRRIDLQRNIEQGAEKIDLDSCRRLPFKRRDVVEDVLLLA